MFKQSLFILLMATGQCLMAQNRGSGGSGQNYSSTCHTSETYCGSSYSNQGSNTSHHNSQSYRREEFLNKSDKNLPDLTVGSNNLPTQPLNRQGAPVYQSGSYHYNYSYYQTICQAQEVTSIIKLTADTELPTRWGSKIKFKGGTTVKLNGTMAVEGILASNIEVPSGKLRLHFRGGTKIAVNECGYISQGTLDQDASIPNRKGHMIVHKAGSTVYVDSNGMYHGLIYFQKASS